MKKILIANRGEIAMRIIKSAKKMGIATVAVYSYFDRNAPHVIAADEAICLGENASSASYLDGEKIVKEAKKLGVDGIHPGYGFLSENADFAALVEANGMIFIGPNQYAIVTMGSKLAAKEAVAKYNIPMVPGMDTAITDIQVAKKHAMEIGFPILIKASAGGGGKGMRIVENSEEFESQMERAVSEAISAFGDGSVFIEKYITKPRHIEIQVLSDSHGNHLHLFERECSIQRRHQKVIEEAPSSVLTPELRKKMGQTATDVARACHYVGAGTVEFLLDEQMNYYFLEMNTRLQVEHPVTEMITGIDLVEQQLLIARGEAIAFKQEDLSITGHALELRIYAEDPDENFAPNIGRLERFRPPVGVGVRLDSGYEEGMEIPIYYDPMIAKLITYGANRKIALQRMLTAIADFEIKGIKTTLPFGQFVATHPAFISGDFDTGFVNKYFTPEARKQHLIDEAILAAQLAKYLLIKNEDMLKLPV